MKRLTHIDADGEARMVDVSAKPMQLRQAVARGEIRLQKETLKLTAPEAPGEYDYVCTYPEHWKVMFGQLIVVADAEAILKASAQPPAPQSQTVAVKHQHDQH